MPHSAVGRWLRLQTKLVKLEQRLAEAARSRAAGEPVTLDQLQHLRSEVHQARRFADAIFDLAETEVARAQLAAHLDREATREGRLKRKSGK